MTPTPQPVRVREVLDLALERPARERAAFIAGVCGDDERLRDEVVSLMRALETGGELLEPPPAAPAPPAEPLTGLRFGAYHVAERVGEGGMGVVYRAQDTRLGRTVAVKALPATVARDPHRRARFEHEARVLASLTHPNIAAIHGVEDTARGPVLVLEFVPGETLAQRLTRGALAIDEATATAIQIARGLEAAHAAGVVHRDLKPSNIQLTPEGGVKILDFGVAKQAPPITDSDGSPPASVTLAGSLVGTAAYMSPEQARGRPVDRRADLWAFGCVLFEMLTGRRAFDGDTPSDTVAAVLRADPDWARLPTATRAPVARLLRRCLQKDPDLRQRDAGDARLELLGDQEETASAARRRAPALTMAALLALGAGVAGGVIWARAGRGLPPSSPAPVRFELNLDSAAPVAPTAGGAIGIARDGRALVYAGGPGDRTRLYARRFDSHETIELPGTDGAGEPCFSPDGRWIAFRSAAQLRRVPAAGGGAEVLVPADVSSAGLAWDGRGIAFVSANPRSLRRFTPAGDIEQLVQFDAAQWPHTMHPEPLPGGDAFLLTVVTPGAESDAPAVEAVRVATGERRVVVNGASGARFMPPDRIVFWQAGALMAAPFDAESLRVTDAPTVMLRPLAGGEIGQIPRFAVSPAGVLATLPGNVRYDNTRLGWFLPDGSWTEIARGGPGIDAPRLSPDGGRVAFLIGRQSGDVWIHDLERGTRIRLTTGDHHHHPVWTPDGKHVVFGADGSGDLRLVRALADGSAPPETLWEAPEGTWAYPTDFAADGMLMLTVVPAAGGPIDLFEYDPRTREPPRRLFPNPAHRYGARLSPDGAMIAHTSEETNTMEVYVHRFPSLESKRRVSANGGYRPVWSGDGRRLFFRYGDRVMVADVDGSGPEIVLSPERVIAEHLPDARYDVSADGQRLLMARPPGELGPQLRIDVVVGWNPASP